MVARPVLKVITVTARPQFRPRLLLRETVRHEPALVPRAGAWQPAGRGRHVRAADQGGAGEHDALKCQSSVTEPDSAGKLACYLGFLSCPRGNAPKPMLARGRVRPWSRGLKMPADLPAGHLLPYSARPRRPYLASSGRTGRVLRVLPAARPRVGRARRGNRAPEEVIEPVRIMEVLHARHHQWDRYGGYASGLGADHWGGT